MNRVKLEERGAWIIEVHLIRGQNLPMLDWCVMVIDEGEDKREEGKEEGVQKE